MLGGERAKRVELRGYLNVVEMTCLYDIRWECRGDVVVPSVFFMEGSIIQDILERRIDKCDEEMEIPEKSTNKSNMAMNVSVLSGPYLLMTDLHSQLMTLNDLRTLGGQACLRLGCFAVAWGIMVRRDRRAPHTAMPTAAFESIFG
ncbi:hypothetical protein Tco_1211432 [Tanacetum coccineum]